MKQLFRKFQLTKIQQHSVKNYLLLQQQLGRRSFNTYLNHLNVEATDRKGKTFAVDATATHGRTEREISEEEKYAAEHDHELLQKLAQKLGKTFTVGGPKPKNVSDIVQEIKISHEEDARELSDVVKPFVGGLSSIDVSTTEVGRSNESNFNKKV
ncbi:hypothetical protein ABK040_007251 [Willaertia magna]